MGIAYTLFKEESLSEFERGIHKGLQYIIAIALWLFVSLDLINYFHLDGQTDQLNLSLSIWWLIYATLLLAISVARIFRPLRKLGMVLFGLVILKVFLYEIFSS